MAFKWQQVKYIVLIESIMDTSFFVCFLLSFTVGDHTHLVLKVILLLYLIYYLLYELYQFVVYGFTNYFLDLFQYVDNIRNIILFGYVYMLFNDENFSVYNCEDWQYSLFAYLNLIAWL